MLRGKSSILFYTSSVDSVDTIIARTSCSLVAAVSCCSPGLRLVLMLYVLPLQTHARVTSESVDTAPHLTTRRSCIRFTMPDPAPGPAAVLCPLSSLHPASPDWRSSDFTSFTPLRDSVKLCLSGLELEILHNNKSELKPTEVFVPICHWWLGFL